jgi:hypothetical protein
MHYSCSSRTGAVATPCVFVDMGATVMCPISPIMFYPFPPCQTTADHRVAVHTTHYIRIICAMQA